MSAIKIADNVHWVGVKDPDLRVFDIVVETKNGTTYNSYLIQGENETALIDTVKAGFVDEFFSNLKQLTDLEKIDYLIVNHTESDHSGAIVPLLEINPKIKLVCSAPALPFVQNTVNNPEVSVTGIKENHEIDLGGKRLLFKMMPYMHWPDTMMEYLEEDKILFPCDGFAGHYAFDSIWADECDHDIDWEVEYYYKSIMRTYAMYIRKNMPKLDGLDIHMIAPSHGPLFRQNPKKYIDNYKLWSADKTIDRNQITLFYTSSYGNTKNLALGLERHLKAAGYELVMIDCADIDVEYARDMIEQSKALIYGTPTFNGDAVKPIWDAIMLLQGLSIMGKKTAVFGSYGWGGEGIKLVAERLAGLRLKVYEENFRARLVPSGEEMTDLKTWSQQVAEFIG